MLFDDAGLDQAYIVHHRDAFAIPGAAHPVVTGPCSDMLYIWALAGRSDELLMVDVPEFAYLKRVEALMNEVEAARPRQGLPANEFVRLATKHDLNDAQQTTARLHLAERGIHVQ
jgi:hypothetical protein